MIDAGQSAFLEMMPFYVKDNVFFIPEVSSIDSRTSTISKLTLS